MTKLFINIFFLLFLKPEIVFSAASCVNVFENTFNSTALTENFLKELVGSKIFFKKNHNYTDPGDSRLNQKTGLVLATKLWQNDGNPYVSIRLITESGPKVYPIFIDDPTFSLTIKERSEVPDLKIEVNSEIRLPSFLMDPMTEIEFFKNQSNKKMNILYVKHENSRRAVFKKIVATSTVVAYDEMDVLFASARNTPLLIAFKTEDGVVEIALTDIVAVSFSP